MEDTPGLGSGALVVCRFDSCLEHDQIKAKVAQLARGAGFKFRRLRVRLPLLAPNAALASFLASL